MDVESVNRLLDDRGAKEIPISDVDSNQGLLVGSDGQTFHEVSTNLWATDKEDIAYLGTGRHGGGIVLRAMFVRVDDDWINVVTGTRASFKITSDGCAHDIDAVRVLDYMDETKKLKAFAEICDAFSWADQLSDVYQALCKRLGNIFRCHEVHMHLMNDDYTSLLKCASYSTGLPFEHDSRSLSSTVGRIEWMKETCEPIFMDYENPDPNDEIPSAALEYGMVSAVSIPVYVGTNVMGFISIVYPFRAKWDEDDKAFLDTVGRVIGTLVERLYDTKKASQLQVLSERKLLSTEIHENISSLIGALSINAAAALESYKEDDLENMAVDLQRLETTANEVMRTLRDEMLSLRISLEKTNGLIEGIEESLQLFEENWGIHTELIVECDEDPIVVPLHVSLQLTRILNESLSNVIRHAKATKISVRITQNDEAIIMTVKDNGIGFDMDSIEPGHFGLRIMRERAENAGGTLAISSGAEGTCVRVDVLKA